MSFLRGSAAPGCARNIADDLCVSVAVQEQV